MALARRSRRFPELALSLETLLMPAVGYPALMLAVGLERLGLPGVAPVFFVALSAIIGGGLDELLSSRGRSSARTRPGPGSSAAWRPGSCSRPSEASPSTSD